MPSLPPDKLNRSAVSPASWNSLVWYLGADAALRLNGIRLGGKHSRIWAITLTADHLRQPQQ
jgi:hypothetical protein